MTITTSEKHQAANQAEVERIDRIREERSATQPDYVAKYYATEVRATFLITINGKSAWITCYSFDEGKRFTTFGNIALAKVGRTGTKLWPSHVYVWKQEDGSYRASMHSVHLNRQAVIVDWNVEEYGRYLSNHNSAGR